MLDRCRRSEAPDLTRIVVAIDPAVSSHEGSDETGIVVAGKDDRGHGYILEDLSGRYAPAEWARVAIAAYRSHGADRIVAEVNQGGDLVEATIRTIDANIPFTAVHASRGKYIRAEPVAALYEQNRCHHVGTFAELEDQMTGFTADMDRGKSGSPDRCDAAVWAITELLVEEEAYSGLMEWWRREAEGDPVRVERNGSSPIPSRGAMGNPTTRVFSEPFRCFQAAAGCRYEADEAGEIEVEDGEDRADLLRAGCWEAA